MEWKGLVPGHRRGPGSLKQYRTNAGITLDLSRSGHPGYAPWLTDPFHLLLAGDAVRGPRHNVQPSGRNRFVIAEADPKRKLSWICGGLCCGHCDSWYGF